MNQVELLWVQFIFDLQLKGLVSIRFHSSLPGDSESWQSRHVVHEVWVSLHQFLHLSTAHLSSVDSNIERGSVAESDAVALQRLLLLCSHISGWHTSSYRLFRQVTRYAGRNIANYSCVVIVGSVFSLQLSCARKVMCLLGSVLGLQITRCEHRPVYWDGAVNYFVIHGDGNQRRSFHFEGTDSFQHQLFLAALLLYRMIQSISHAICQWTSVVRGRITELAGQLYRSWACRRPGWSRVLRPFAQAGRLSGGGTSFRKIAVAPIASNHYDTVTN